jgi:hypothetical protein
MNAKKFVCAALVFMAVGISLLSAQTSSQVDTWLNEGVRKSDSAVRLARQNAEANAERIANLLDDVTDILLRVQNYANQGNMTTSAQDQKLQKIGANINECSQRLSAVGYGGY